MRILLFLLFLLSTRAFQQRIYYPFPIETIFSDDQLWKQFEKKKDFKKWQKGLYNIEMSYKESLLGYHYHSRYQIIKEDHFIRIHYENKFIQNNITIWTVDQDSIDVSIDSQTKAPIPTHVVNRIISSKLQHLFRL